jgi:hypothetical protein
MIAGEPASSPSPLSLKEVRAVEVAAQCMLFLGYLLKYYYYSYTAMP